MSELQATPYVPGRARGTLKRGPAGSGDSICMVKQSELGESDARPAGFIVVEGAPFSHRLLRLLTLGIPAVLVSADAAKKLKAGNDTLIDGFSGTVVQPAPPETQAAPSPQPGPAGKAFDLPDGSSIELRASIHGIEDARLAVRQGAAAIGLVRTEFIAPGDGRQPDFEFYREALAALCETSAPIPVTLRLPDIRQDKPVPWLTPSARLNTPLGLQGVRLFDSQPVRSVLDAMLNAIDQLPDIYPIRLLMPYVTRLDEFLYWRDIIRQRVRRSVPIGAMAESPVAVLAIKNWLEHADFIAIGCNDLMQCLFAADRDLAELRPYLDQYSPELYRFLQIAAQSAAGREDSVQLCGLLPQLKGVLPVLVGMGFRNFSVAPVMVPYLAQTARSLDLSEAEALARQVCQAEDNQAVRSLLERTGAR